MTYALNPTMDNIGDYVEGEQYKKQEKMAYAMKELLSMYQGIMTNMIKGFAELTQSYMKLFGDEGVYGDLDLGINYGPKQDAGSSSGLEESVETSGSSGDSE